MAGNASGRFNQFVWIDVRNRPTAEAHVYNGDRLILGLFGLSLSSESDTRQCPLSKNRKTVLDPEQIFRLLLDGIAMQHSMAVPVVNVGEVWMSVG